MRSTQGFKFYRQQLINVLYNLSQHGSMVKCIDQTINLLFSKIQFLGSEKKKKKNTNLGNSLEIFAN